MKNNYSPIVLFVYNRLWHTQKTIEALQKNTLAEESELIIYCDGVRNEKEKQAVSEVRTYVKSIDGFKKITVIERDSNWGLANSIIDGVTSVVNQYGTIIVLEDDLVTSPSFLKYMNDALDCYEHHNEVVSIHGYTYPLKNTEGLADTFFLKGADCWGWATWQRGWSLFEADGEKLLAEIQTRKCHKEINMNNSYGYVRMLKKQIAGKNDSWAIRWYVSAFLKDKLTLYPKISFVQNIGNDSSGTHCSHNDIYFIEQLNTSTELLFDSKIEESLMAKKSFEAFYRSSFTILKRALAWLQK